MGSYAYKFVRDLLPEYITEAIEDYEGSVDYDGDQWSAAADYINALEREVIAHFRATGCAYDERLIEWLKHRPKTYYADGGFESSDT